MPRTPLKQLFAADKAAGSVQQREILTNWHKVSFSSSFSCCEIFLNIPSSLIIFFFFFFLRVRKDGNLLVATQH